jgi:hypothetical protein
MSSIGPITGGEEGGGSPITDPNIAYIRSDGNDATGNGSPSAPYLTAQAAVTAGFNTLDLGVGSFGNITYNDNTNRTLFFHGRGTNNTVIGNITNAGGGDFELYMSAVQITLVSTLTPNASPLQNALNAGNVTIQGDANSTIMDINASGGNGGDGDGSTPSGDGGDAGGVTLTGPLAVVNSLAVVGGSAGTDNGGGSGSAGNNGPVSLSRCPSTPTPNPDAANVSGAIINGTFYGATYP